ncbi:NAD(P)/FAD-dependent oxidoreductase [Deinococcus ruber]|uniref:Thioredoxin-disulfide reductase n=1 Tax=Deinococcus ruber TaxID=1848197 RepID=A0A918CGR4_9DEIO|nr:NAD(P)/FAD-dependent oxidoreductase [Deinococcus ruber]GGR21094.1 thioredoxin-disulfide reductase [Deinococcus ruber]
MGDPPASHSADAAPPAATYDCVIVGGGPAGLSAAVYMGRFRRTTLLIDSGEGRWAYGQHNENYLGFPKGVSARRLRALGVAQAERFGVVPHHGRVEQIDLLPAQQGFTLATTAGQVIGRTVIWAAGVRDRWPTFRGARRLVGKQLFWCIVCDGWRTLDREILLLGNIDAAAEDALQFLTYTSRVTLLVEPGKDELSPTARRKLHAGGIQVRSGEVRSVRLKGQAIENILLTSGELLHADLIFSLYGSDPNTELLRHLPITLTPRGMINIDPKYQTNLARFYAAGDVTDHHSDQVASAVHGGAQAAQAANYALYPPRQRLST